MRPLPTSRSIISEALRSPGRSRSSTNGCACESHKNPFVPVCSRPISPIDHTLSHLTSRLKLLSLRESRLSGTIAEQLLRKWDDLAYLYLDATAISGTLPVDLGELSALRTLRLSNAALSGTVPEVLAHIQNLDELTLHSNRLSGTISSAFVNVTSESCAFSFTAQQQAPEDDQGEPRAPAASALVPSSNKFTCLAGAKAIDLGPACGLFECESVAAAGASTQTGLAVVTLLIALVLVVFAGVKLRARQERRKQQLLKEVTGTSSAVVNELADRKFAGNSIVIVDGKSMPTTGYDSATA